MPDPAARLKKLSGGEKRRLRGLRASDKLGPPSPDSFKRAAALQARARALREARLS